MFFLAIGIQLVLLAVVAWFAIAPTPGRRAAGVLALAGSSVFGFASTVVTLALSFHSLADVNPADKATILSNGLSEGMNCLGFSMLFILPMGACFIAGIVRMRRAVPLPPS